MGRGVGAGGGGGPILAPAENVLPAERLVRQGFDTERFMTEHILPTKLEWVESH